MPMNRRLRIGDRVIGDGRLDCSGSVDDPSFNRRSPDQPIERFKAQIACE
jgi:hypothetical protein